MSEKANCRVCNHPVPPGHTYCGVCGHSLLESGEEVKQPDYYWLGAGISVVAVFCAVALLFFTR